MITELQCILADTIYKMYPHFHDFPGCLFVGFLLTYFFVHFSTCFSVLSVPLLADIVAAAAALPGWVSRLPAFNSDWSCFVSKTL